MSRSAVTDFGNLKNKTFTTTYSVVARANYKSRFFHKHICHLSDHMSNYIMIRIYNVKKI